MSRSHVLPVRLGAALIAIAVCASVWAWSAPVNAQTAPAVGADRSVEPVVMTGLQFPEWSRLPAEGVANPYPSGAGGPNPFGDGLRDAHNGTLTIPPDARTGAPVEEIAAFAWNGTRFAEVPVQVDERFPYFLANGRADFGWYSGTDKELTYEWDVESWKKTAGQCEARYPDTDDTLMPGFPTEDPVTTLDDDDEIVVMASDAGGPAPSGAVGPPLTSGRRYEVRLTDPTDPAAERFVYLFLKSNGSSFDSDNGYVDYQRDANADQWVDRGSWANSDPEKLGTSNTGYGPNLEGTVCDPDGAVRQSNDRFVRDGVTVTTDAYKWRATGRWMVRNMQVAKSGAPGAYGPDLIDRWKGRAFQQSPESQISLVGFEDEQVNWEANSALLGERAGAVRAIREVWGADSGTNVTKTEYFYRDAVLYRYRVRVHPIPPDGLYTSWDYNHDKVGHYFNELNSQLSTDGVLIDGVNDDVGNIDGVEGFPAFFDAPDPTFNKPLANFNWEQVSGNGDNGSLVYMFELKNQQGLENAAVVPYYRDDACFDDGTGDDPTPHPHPGDFYTADEKTAIPCYTEAPEGYQGPYRQGAFGSHGIHYFFTGDTDNSFSPERTTEIDGQQWQWAVPTNTPHAVGDPVANTVKTPLVATPVPQENAPAMYATDLAYTGDTSGQVTDQATLAARLTSAGEPVPGKGISFLLNGEEVGSATTDQGGRASTTVALSGPAGAKDLTARFAGDDEYTADDATAAFSVAREDSSLTLTIEQTKKSTVLTAVLTETDAARGLADRQIVFSVAGGDVGSATTDGTGAASLTLTKGIVRRGSRVTADFGGDDSFLGAAASAVSPR